MLTSQSIVAALQGKGTCRGAIFCSYNFDPVLFEEIILPGIVGVSADPESDPTRFHVEMRAALQMVPVACVVDGSAREPGHRLPYDLLDVRRRVFHPKVYVTLWETEARIAVGSGNVTRGGFGANEELFYAKALSYADADDAALLRELAAFLGALPALAVTPGTQLPRILEDIDRIVNDAPRDPRTRAVTFVSTQQGAIVDQVRALLPTNAKVRRVGVLTPFHEQDVRASDEDVQTTLGTLADLMPEGARRLDVGIAWDNAPIAPEGRATKLEAALGRLWAWRQRTNDGPVVEYFTPRALGGKQLEYVDRTGASRREDRGETERLVEAGDAWPVPDVIAWAPRAILERLRDANVDVNLYLHPAQRFEGDRPVRRPLHAKVLVVQFRAGQSDRSLVVIGSPNASRKALLLGSASGANIESAMVVVVDGVVTIQDLVPSLTWSTLECAKPKPRELPEMPVNYGAWIVSVTHDAKARSLEVEWAADGPPIPDGWSLRYADRDLTSGKDVPRSSTRIDDFELMPVSCEVQFVVGANTYSVPILVRDLLALPIEAALADLGLRELLALMGGRLGRERLADIRTQRGAAACDAVLDAIFGTGFGPTDVFKAWWSVEQDAMDAAISVNALRVSLFGALGAGAVWTKLREAAGTGAITREEAWLYGAELARTLARAKLPPTSEGVAKQKLVVEFLVELRASLAELTPRSDTQPWLGPIVSFYSSEVAS